jgi:antitoxin (DNA-binding transcriptional repressor) of toxin-antitoxin stability system
MTYAAESGVAVPISGSLILISTTLIRLTMIIDHGKRYDVEEMAISKFKATCLATLERVRRTGRPLRVTRFGKPVADVVPPSPEPPRRDWIGSMRGTLEIRGDITAPSGELVKWESLQ